MLQPNDLPLICLPTELSDAAAAKLVEFLHELTEALERHYFAQLRRHYSTSDTPQSDPPISTSGPHRAIPRSDHVGTDTPAPYNLLMGRRAHR